MKEVISELETKEIEKYIVNNITSIKDKIKKASSNIFKSGYYKEPILFICGNNYKAYIAYILASVLSSYFNEITILQLDTLNKSHHFLKLIDKIKIIKYNDDFNFSNYETIIDAIKDIDDKKNYNDIILKINNLNKFIISVDINSGLNPINGMADKAIKSDLTISFKYRTGHFLNMAKDNIKEIVNIDIIDNLGEHNYKLIEDEDMISILPRRNNFSNKGDYGYVGLIGGSLNYSGAIKLATLANASLRSGAGVVKIGVPDNLLKYLIPEILEATVYPFKSINKHIAYNEKEIDEFSSNLKSITIGMGLGRSMELKKIIIYLLNNYDKLLIIDADGLNMLSEVDKDIIKKKKPKLIITPHLKEFSRLTKLSVQDILSDIINISKKYAKDNNLILLLKGPTTIVTDGFELYLIKYGNSGMATAGSGDVLSGIISGVSGYISDPVKIAYISAYINGMAGDLANKKINSYSMLASDTIKEIPNVLEKMIAK